MKRIIIAALIFVLIVTGTSCKEKAPVAEAGPGAPDVSQSAPASTAPAPVSSDTSSAEPSSPEPSGGNNVIMLEGTIGNIPVHMSLRLSDGLVTGTYYYDSVGKELKLEGTTEADRMVAMNEYDENGKLTGKFDGWYTHNISLTGSWTNGETNETLNFNLKVIGGIPLDAVWAGEWHRMDTGRFASATLVIFNESKSGFSFQMDAYNASHMGFIDGTAVIDGAVAHFKDKETSAELTFSLKNGVVEAVSKGDISYYAGANVIFDGRYTQEPLPEDTLLSMGYVPDASHDSAMHTMTGSDYELFLNTAQIRRDAEDLDGLGAQVSSWWVFGFAGSNESILMLLPDGKICAAVIDPDGSRIKVFTNADNITEVPKTIEVWIINLQELLGVTSDIPVEFHGSEKN